MESLWSEYERRQLWPGQQFENEHPEVLPRSYLQEIWDWEDYAVQNFVNWISAPDVQLISETPGNRHWND